MEDNIQTIIVMIISAFLLFIFPVYMAYEKKDDISYALAMRYTQDLVDEVRSKGYISKYMYDDYKARLKVTGNSYDISLTHKYTRFDPVTNYYKTQDNKYLLVKTTTQIEKDEILQKALDKNDLTKNDLKDNEKLSEYFTKYFNLNKDNKITKVEDTYKESIETFPTEHILGVLNTEKKLAPSVDSDNIKCVDNGEYECQAAYIMNEGDDFNVTIKNTNTTLATVMYNMVTANQLDTNTRIYVNYGGKILSNKWYKDIDYSKMKHDKLNYTTLEEIMIKIKNFPNDITDSMSQGEINTVNDILKANYAIEFEAKPDAVTELRNKGYENTTTYEKYNFAVGNSKDYSHIKNQSMMSISVGLNGVSIIGSNVNEEKVVANSALSLPTYNRYVERERIVQEEYTYIDEETNEEKTGYRDKVEKYIETIPTKRTLDEYSYATFRYVNNKLQVILTGKDGVEDAVFNIDVEQNKDLIQKLNIRVDISNGKGTQEIEDKKSVRGSKIMCTATIGDAGIALTAIRYNMNEQTILSCPTEISDFTKIRVEVRNGMISLIINDEKVDEGIKLALNPIINYIGGTIIGNEQRLFAGEIRNVVLYKLR